MIKGLSTTSKLAKIVGLAVFCMALANCAPQGEGAKGQHEEQPEGPPQPRNDGVGSGGGGDVVVCYDSQGKILDMEAYDLWVAPQNYRLTFERKPLGENRDLEGDQVPYMQQVEAALAALENIDPRFSVEIKRIAVAFTPDEIAKGDLIVMTDAIELNGDSGAAVMDKATSACAKVSHERMFWQVDQPATHQYSYKLVERLWKAAPESVKAAVVSHESIWRNERLLFNEPKTSVNTQYYNAVLHSKEFATYDFKKYLQLLSDLKTADGKSWKENQVFSVKIGDLVYQADPFSLGTGADGEEIIRGRLIEIGKIKVGADQVSITGDIWFNQTKGLVIQACAAVDGEKLVSNQAPIELKEHDQVVLTESGELSKINLQASTCRPGQPRNRPLNAN